MTGIGAVNMLEAVRLICPQARYYQASSSEMFGLRQESVQSEKHALLSALALCCGQTLRALDDSELSGELRLACLKRHSLQSRKSPLRGIEFVTRKITDGVARIKLGHQKTLALGNLDAKRDWGHARDFVRAMWLMLQQEKPDDYVIATGRTESVAYVLRAGFRPCRTENGRSRRHRSTVFPASGSRLFAWQRDKSERQARLGSANLARTNGHRNGRSRPRSRETA